MRRHGDLYGPLPPVDPTLCDLCRRPFGTVVYTTSSGRICERCKNGPSPAA